MLSRPAHHSLAPLASVLLLGIAATPLIGLAQTPPAQTPPAQTPASPAVPTTPAANPQPDQAPSVTPPPEGQPEPPPPPSPAELALKRAKEARALIKDKKFDEGLAILHDLVAHADEAGLTTAEKGDLLDDYGWALHKAGKDTEALEQQIQAVKLVPTDPNLLLDLALAHSRLDHYELAIQNAQEALKMGLKGEDADDARSLIKDARSDRLHDRLEFIGWTAIAFDSNVLENQQYQTIGDQTTVATVHTQTAGRAAVGTRQALGMTVLQTLDDFANPKMPNLYHDLIVSDYRTPAPSLTQWGLPLNVNLDLIGRLVGTPRIGLWLGYRFEQTFMLDAQSDAAGLLPTADTYNYQQHTVTLRLSGKPVKWFDYNVRAEGFVNFSGLAQFSAFQYGVNAVADLILIESKQWRTRLVFTNNYRQSFDQTDDGYLDGNKDTLQLSQELRLKPIRIKLGYQFTIDNTGTLTASSAVNFPFTMTMPQVGTYNYFAPLSYVGNQIFLTARFNLPHAIYIKPGLHYEYQVYADQYYASYSATVATITDPATGKSLTTLSNAQLGNLLTSIDPIQRKDHQVTAELGVSVDLPRDFALALNYTFLDNISNIANSIDNRSYTKHTIELRTTYTF